MDHAIQGMKYRAEIIEAIDTADWGEMANLQHNVQVSLVKVARQDVFALAGAELYTTVVTVVLWRALDGNHTSPPTFAQLHGVHAILAHKFWDLERVSVQVISG